VGLPKADRPERLLAAVNQAVNNVLERETGWRELFWDREGRQLVLQHPVHGQLPLDFLSDGVRTTVALVADAAHRCARLNPHLGENAAKETPGLLLVDEVDLHLHPEWQQSIVRMLRTAFPRLQLVLTTHSPQVLSTVEAHSIREIGIHDGTGEVSIPPIQTQGVGSEDVMASVMHVDSRPDLPQTQWLSEYRALVHAGEHESAAGKSLWARLVEHFGPEHPVMIDIDTFRRLQDFKRENNIPLN
jgi:predicted ATP-binding protein involved in virulence